MSKLHHEYKSEDFNKAFLRYVLDTHPAWTVRTARTCVSDALFVRSAMSSALYEKVMQSDEWTEEVEYPIFQMLVLDVLAMRKKPKRDARGYIRAFRTYFSFIQILTLIENARIDKPRSLKE